jgi:hypothetical protein
MLRQLFHKVTQSKKEDSQSFIPVLKLLGINFKFIVTLRNFYRLTIQSIKRQKSTLHVFII